MRLVDITLLLLLSLMAAASFTTDGPDPPVTHELTDQGMLPAPMQVAITRAGSIHLPGGESVSLTELESVLESWPAEIEFIAEAEAPASRLLAVHAIARRLDQPAAFRVRQVRGEIP
jgi:biopolymer transport protein ExbD